MEDQELEQLKSLEQQTIGKINQRQAQMGYQPFKSNSRFSEEQLLIERNNKAILYGSSVQPTVRGCPMKIINSEEIIY